MSQPKHFKSVPTPLSCYECKYKEFDFESFQWKCLKHDFHLIVKASDEELRKTVCDTVSPINGSRERIQVYIRRE